MEAYTPGTLESSYIANWLFELHSNRGHSRRTALDGAYRETEAWLNPDLSDALAGANEKTNGIRPNSDRTNSNSVFSIGVIGRYRVYRR